jgi:hypothetical protein
VVKINDNNYIFVTLNSTNRTIFLIESGLGFPELALGEGLDFIGVWARNHRSTH